MLTSAEVRKIKNSFKRIVEIYILHEQQKILITGTSTINQKYL